MEGETIFPTNANLLPCLWEERPACKARQPQVQPPLKRGQPGAKANYVGVEAQPEEEEELYLFTLGMGSKKVKPICYQLRNTSMDGA